MKLGKISKVLLLLSVFLVSLMAVSAAFTVDATLSVKNDNYNSDTALICSYTVTGDLVTYETAVTQWFKDGSEQTQYKDTKQTVEKDKLYTVNGPSGISQLNPFESWTCKVTVTQNQETSYDQTYPGVFIKNYIPTLDFTALGVVNGIEDSGTKNIGSGSLLLYAQDKDLTEAEKATKLTFSVQYEDPNKVDCTISSNGASATYKPAPNYNGGDAKCTILITDEFNGCDEQSQKDITFKITGVSDPFSIKAIPDQTAKIGKLFTYNVEVENVDKLAVTFSLASAPVGMSITKVSDDKATISFTPLAAGETTVTVKANANNIDYYKSFKLTVQDLTQPTMASGAIPDKKEATQSTFTLDVKSYISNPDGIALAYSLENAPKGMTISNGVITFATGDNVTTHDNIKVIAAYTFNNEAKTLSDIFKLTVTPPSKIKVSELDVYVNGNKDDDVDENNLVSSLEDSVKPGDTIKIAMRIENTWPEDTKDHDIKDIKAELKFEEMDDDEGDVEKDLEFGRVKPGKESSKKEVSYTLPTDIDDGNYYIKIDIDGKDEDGSNYKMNDVVVITVVVEKEDHKLDFDKFTLTPSTLECSRTTQLSVKLVNTGDSTEDDVQLVLSAPDFNFEEIELLELESGASDDKDVYFSKTYTINVPENKKAGTYVVKGTAYYNAEDEEEEENVVATLTLVDCGTTTATTTTPTTTAPKTETKEKVEVVETQPQTTATTPAISTSVSAGEEKSFFESGLYVGILVAAIIIILLIIIIMVVAIARR